MKTTHTTQAEYLAAAYAAASAANLAANRAAAAPPCGTCGTRHAGACTGPALVTVSCTYCGTSISFASAADAEDHAARHARRLARITAR